MEKVHIIQELVQHHQHFIHTLESLSDADFQRKPGEKWRAGQQLEHIIKSVKPVNMAFGLPMFVLKMKFGTANRPSRSYEALVEKYLRVLEEKQDYVLPDRFAPEEIPLKRKGQKLKELTGLVQKLTSRLAKVTEEGLDTHILPHPVLGKLTLREMLYFTMYHVQHHDKQILENLNTLKNAEKSRSPKS